MVDVGLVILRSVSPFVIEMYRVFRTSSTGESPWTKVKRANSLVRYQPLPAEFQLPNSNAAEEGKSMFETLRKGEQPADLFDDHQSAVAGFASVALAGIGSVETLGVGRVCAGRAGALSSRSSAPICR